jgi:signal peptidase II
MGIDAQGGGVGGVVADAAQSKPDRSYMWGPLSTLGFVVAAIACAIDQATKLWLLFVFDLGRHRSVSLTPFLKLQLNWNTGISYGLFSQPGPFGRWALLAFEVTAVVFLWVWLARTLSKLTAVALGLIIGGAIGNAIDRLHWPGVMDFVLFHVDSGRWSLRWYVFNLAEPFGVFNLADVAIVAGVIGLLYESLLRGGAAKAP